MDVPLYAKHPLHDSDFALFDLNFESDPVLDLVQAHLPELVPTTPKSVFEYIDQPILALLAPINVELLRLFSLESLRLAH